MFPLHGIRLQSHLASFNTDARERKRKERKGKKKEKEKEMHVVKKKKKKKKKKQITKAREKEKKPYRNRFHQSNGMEALAGMDVVFLVIRCLGIRPSWRFKSSFVVHEPQSTK
ncbi:hypothetical protein D8B26_006575 [Coccidioides posadasii str. Silveira]|uniref:uncharacterized protein n=1 Tax=Coccidioides posadasii (strain RMSCC 757 / Silveira) TaxID=443226 RepID=UPI001BEF6A8B|nr:hypothetical protein D8B26_006575 [Coccidioides posadasii str. Silveira]